MKNEDVKIGMKVVPFQKTAKGYTCLEKSFEWGKAKFGNQKFLYVVGREDDSWILCHYNNSKDGDYFNACDFELYIENKLTTKNIEHIIVKNKTIVIIHNEDSTYLKGEAKCNPQDKFNEQEGFRIAYCRAIGKEPFEKTIMVDDEEDKEDNKKKIIDSRLGVNKKLWKRFLDGCIVIQCGTEYDSERLLDYCRQQGIKWLRTGLVATKKNYWERFRQDTCYEIFNGGLRYNDKFEYSTNQMVNYNEVFNNSHSNQLSQVTNEELLEELDSRLNKNN